MTEYSYIKELAERVNILEYRTGAAPPDPPFNPTGPGPQSSFVDTNEFVTRKRPYESLGGPAYYDNSYNPLQDFTPKHDRTHHDPEVTDTLGSEGVPQTSSVQFQSANMNATEVHEKEVKAYAQILTLLKAY